MKDPELDLLIKDLESRADMTIAEMDGVMHALAFLLPGKMPKSVTVDHIGTADGAVLVVDSAYPNGSVHIHSRADDHAGHWRCTLRENESRDNDAAIGSGRSAVLAQAVLAALLRLSMLQKG